MWVWVLSFSILGSKPEHGQIAKFETKQECLRALDQKTQDAIRQGRELVGRCYFTKVEEKAWWK